MTQNIEWLYPLNGNPPKTPKKYKEKDKISDTGVLLIQIKTPLFKDISDNIELFYKDFRVIDDPETALNIVKDNLYFEIKNFEEIQQSLRNYYLKNYNIKLTEIPPWDKNLLRWIHDVYIGNVKIIAENKDFRIYLYTVIEVKKYFNYYLENKLKPKYNPDVFYQQFKIQFNTDQNFNILYNYFYNFIHIHNF